MNVVPLHARHPKNARRYVNLVGESAALAKIPLAQFQTDFEIRRFSPQEIIDQAAHEQERMMQEAVATLIDWDERSPVVLSMLKDVACRNAVPLVVLCGSNRAEQVAALVVGGDTCLTYPLNPIMLQARLLAYQRLARSTSLLADLTGDGMLPVVLPAVDLLVSQEHDVNTSGSMMLDRTARQFFARGQLVELTPKEFDLMGFLMDRAGACQSRDEILDQVWGISYETGTNVLDVLLHGLRRKLARHGLKDVIQTVRGVGYRLVDPQAVER